jgi:uncharacterized membrane protein
MIVTYSFYFVAFARMPATHSFLAPFILLTATTITQVVILIIASIVFRVMDGPPVKKDERDRAIAHRASSASYYVLMMGMIVVGCIMPFTDSGWKVANAGVFAIVVAEIVQHGLIVLGYRRGVRV